MSENLAAVKSAPPCNAAAVARALAQVEKWMAVIRDIKQERTAN